jgi:PAS domain S-box-containing protein
VTDPIDTERALESLVGAGRRLLDVALARLWVVDPPSGDAVCVVSDSAPEDPVDLDGAPRRCRPGEGVVGWVLQHAEPRFSPVPVGEGGESGEAWVTRERLVSQLAVPLRRGATAIGALVVLTRAPREFSARERDALQTLATQAALAVDLRRLYGEARQRLRDTETLLAVGQAVGSTLELTEVVRRATREVVRALGADTGSAWRVGPGGRWLVPIAGYHTPKDIVVDDKPVPVLPQHAAVEHIRRLREPVYASDSRGDPRFDYPLLRRLPHKSVLVVPMRSGEAVLGVLVVVWLREHHRFTEEELRLVDGIVRQAAMAIENARLLETVRRREELQARLLALTRDLAAETDPGRLFALTAEQARRIMGVDAAVLFLVEGDRLAIGAAAGAEEGLVGAEDLRAEGRFAGAVLRDGRPVACADLAGDPDWREAAIVLRFGFRSVLAVPLVVTERTLGVLQLLHREPRDFPSDDVEFVSGLATQAALAIANARLALETHARLRETETLLTVSRATSSTLDSTEIMRRVAREIARALGADYVAAYLANAGGTALYPLTGYRLPEGLAGTAPENVIPLRGHPFFESAWEQRRPVHTGAGERDFGLLRRIYDRHPFRSLLFVPMIVKGAPIGGFIAVWGDRVRRFSPAELRLVEGISQQSGLAADNARLFASQREEAEISAALLKLVDAVAVRQELDELLETVVQTTAQLLGRRRGALFLMDPTEDVLIPTKAWGVSPTHEPAFRRFRRAARIRAVVKAIQTREPVVVEDARVERSLPRRLVRDLDLRSVLIMPLTSGGRVLGILAVDTPGEPHVFWPKEIALARGIATYAAVAIANAGLFAEKVQRSEARLRAVMDHVPDGIVTFDAHGVIESINPAGEHLFRYAPGTLVGRDFRALVVETDALAVTAAAAREATGRRGDGTTFPIELAVGEVALGARRVMIASVRDSTERRRAEEALRQARIEAERANRLKSALLANMSHEIRTPLNVILGYATLLGKRLDASSDPRERAFLTSIRQASQRLMDTMQKIVDISRFHIDDFPLRPRAVGLAELVGNCIETLRVLAEQKALTLTLDAAAAPVVHADPYAVTQAVTNVIENAIKYTAEGRVEVRLRQEAERGVVVVRDTGIGISAEFLPSVFDEFSQEASGYGRRYEGTGLGLSLAKKFVEASGGTITVESRKGRGSAFTLAFPLAGAAPPSSARPLPVLLVEDDRLTREFMRTLLGPGFVVHAASDAAEAWAVLDHQPVDLILMDLSLAGPVDGLELTRQLRRTERWRATPVIALTAHAHDQDRENALAAGCDAYLAKPFEGDALTATMRGLLSSGGARKTPPVPSLGAAAEPPMRPETSG